MYNGILLSHQKWNNAICSNMDRTRDCLQGFPGGSVSEGRIHLQCRKCRRHGFNLWVGKTPWRRKWQPAPIFLPGESHGQRSLVGYSSRGGKESDVTEWIPFPLSFSIQYCLPIMVPASSLVWSYDLRHSLSSLSYLPWVFPLVDPESLLSALTVPLRPVFFRLLIQGLPQTGMHLGIYTDKEPGCFALIFGGWGQQQPPSLPAGLSPLGRQW